MLVSSVAIDRRAAFSPRAMTIFSVIAAVTFSASSSAPTPLYHLYQQSFGLSPLLVTVIFAVYALSLLATLLTVGALSDYIGRRPVLFAALALNALGLVMFITANSALALILARIVQGIAVGAATTTLGAAILDTDRARGPLLNSITAFLGLMVGSLGAGALVAFAPAPAQLVYAILFAITLVELLVLVGMPETTPGRSGGLLSLRPHIEVPAQALPALIRVTPVNIAAWALGGFYLSLMPSLVRVATGLNSPFVGGAVVATLMFSATVAVLVLRHWPAHRILLAGALTLALGVAVTLAGVYLQLAALLFLGTIIAGLGFGGSFSGVLRTILPLASADERAGLLSSFYVESYLAFALPAIAAGLTAPVLGLAVTAYVFGAVLIVLAAISFVATMASRNGG